MRSVIWLLNRFRSQFLNLRPSKNPEMTDKEQRNHISAVVKDLSNYRGKKYQILKRKKTDDYWIGPVARKYSMEEVSTTQSLQEAIEEFLRKEPW